MPLDKVEEKRFEDLGKACRELKVPAPPAIFIDFEVTDKDGNVILTDRQRGHSWTRNFYNYLLSAIAGAAGGGSNNFGAGYVSVKTIGGAVRYFDAYLCVPYTSSSIALGAFINGSVGDNTFGIQIGVADSGFSPEHYTLSSLIAHGNGAAQVSYTAHTPAVCTYDSTAGSEKFTAAYKRFFNNNSGATITVKETGIVGYMLGFYPNPEKILLERSVLSPTIDVVNGAQLAVTYNIVLDYSSID